MIVVIFEVKIRENKIQSYLDWARQLLTELEKIDGFISIERFQSLNAPEKLLSMSLWRDELSIQRWRENAQHQSAQHAGRAEIFSEYRIRVGEIQREYDFSAHNSNHQKRV